MKKHTIILYCFLAVFLALLGASVFLMKKKRDFRRSIAVMPEFCLPQARDSILFCSEQFEKGKPIVVMYFHPECDFCHAKAKQLQQGKGKVAEIKWVLVSYAERDSVKKFMETYGLADISNIVVLVDSQLYLYDRLHVEKIPTYFIYNRDHHLVPVKRGDSKLETIIRLANQ